MLSGATAMKTFFRHKQYTEIKDLSVLIQLFFLANYIWVVSKHGDHFSPAGLLNLNYENSLS